MNGPTDPQSPLAKLRADYIEAKLLSDQTTLEQFSAAPQAVRDTLLSKGRAKGVIPEQTTDEMFYSMWSTDPVKKKD